MFKYIEVKSEENYQAKVCQGELTSQTSDITVQVHYSCLNYKDALALTGKGKILRNFPLVPGIDASGVVINSNCKNFPVGSNVLVNGSGFGETRNGGFSEKLYSPEELLVALPDKMSLKQSMSLGTAGFTAALALHRLEHNGLTPESGPVLVSGATGGVGSIACLLLRDKGYEVHAVTSKMDKEAYLSSLGVEKVFTHESLGLDNKPLSKARYAAAIDNIGGEFLSNVLACVDLFGSVASIGLASSHQFSASVMPFILRGVSILGISSANTPMDIRRNIWKSLGRESFLNALDKMDLKESSLEDLNKFAEMLIDRKYSGRVLVNLKSHSDTQG